MDKPSNRRWVRALLGGILLPVDPLLGMVLLIVGLWRPRKRQAPVSR